MGSGELIQTLMRHDLVDEYLLFIHPLVLGSGWRMFSDGSPPAPYFSSTSPPRRRAR